MREGGSTLGRLRQEQEKCCSAAAVPLSLKITDFCSAYMHQGPRGCGLPHGMVGRLREIRYNCTSSLLGGSINSGDGSDTVGKTLPKLTKTLLFGPFFLAAGYSRLADALLLSLLVMH